MEMTKEEKKEFWTTFGSLVLILFGAWLLTCCLGCMQVVGADSIDMWGLKIKANAGTKFYAGAQQYDGANETLSKSTQGRSEVKY